MGGGGGGIYGEGVGLTGCCRTFRLAGGKVWISSKTATEDGSPALPHNVQGAFQISGQSKKS